ncbi:MAG TPA: hypothetical protein VJV78_41220 [Polyangiales bacterium]|nr:hypothetical protein [Polyangiales bacterium]
MSSSAAKKLVGKVNVRMAKAADATAGASDPMRAAVSLALFQAPQPPNSMAAAKVRLRLYAGLNEWALEAIFTPQPGVIAGCVREVGASQSECEALVAAAARSSVAQIRPVAGGSAAPGGYAAQGAAPAAAGGGRFSRFSSGYPQQQAAPAPRYGAQQYPQQQYPQQQYQQPRYPQQYPQQQYPQQQYQQPRYPQQNYAPPQQYQAQRYPQQGYQQQQYQRPVAAPVAPPPPPQPVISAQEQQSRKDAYKAQREAYMARQKQQFEDRKNKVGAVAEADRSEAPPRNGVETPAAAQPAAPAASKPAAASAATASAAKPAAKPAASNPLDDEPSEPVAAKSGGGKPALDNDFLDGLLDDPLANKNKK